MKKLFQILLVAVLSTACLQEDIELLETENNSVEESNLNEEISVNGQLKIPTGFSFESTTRTISNIRLDESFKNENVKIKLYQSSFLGNQLIFDGFVNLERPLNESFKIANHINDMIILASFNGVEKQIKTTKTDIRAIFNIMDFSASNSKNKVRSIQNDYIFCEDGGANGLVEIYQRVLVIKGSVFDDELNLDKNNNKTKVILKTNGSTSVDTEFSNSSFDCIFIYLDNGKDIVNMGSTEKPSLINLGNGTDEITASDQAKDIIFGGNGKDKITGKFIDDELIGGNGNDDIDNSSGGVVTQDGAQSYCMPPCYSESYDSDGDGFDSVENGGIDVDDNNPNVIARSYPQGMGLYYSMIFEDLWPCQGDYDFNDLILNFNFIEGRNEINAITEVEFDFKIPALGGSYNNFAVLRVQDTDDNAIVNLNDLQTINVTRVHDQLNQTTLFYFEDLKSFYTNNQTAIINTREMTYETILQLSGVVTGVDGVYDIFMLKDGNSSAEIHPDVNDGIEGTSSFFNTELGGCHEGSNLDFKTDDGFPWGMVIPVEWEWPKEGVNILDAYPDFRTFVESNPNIDWYSTNNTSRVLDAIIQ